MIAALTLPPTMGLVGCGVVVGEEDDGKCAEVGEEGEGEEIEGASSVSERIEWLSCWRFFSDGATG